MTKLDTLLKSLGPQDPEWLKKSQEIWSQLDNLAQNDPIAYKKFIQDAQKEAQEARLVKPGWGITTFMKHGDAFKKVYINIGISERISPPPSLDLNNVHVPLIVGTPRSFDNTLVIDIVYHSSVINKTFDDVAYCNAILELSFGACKEVLDWEITTFKGLEKKKNVYYGRYGWDDKGKPLSDSKEVIYKEETECDTSALSINASKETMDDISHKNLIQEIKEIRLEKKEPIFKTINDTEMVKILIYLPEISSGTEADVQLHESRLTVDTASNHLSVEIKGIERVSSAEFSKASGILKRQMRSAVVPVENFKVNRMIDDAECDICGSAHSPAVNPIMFCDGLGCDVPVHQKCYKVESIPDGSWYCRRCADKVPIYATNVVCCQQKSGALLRTSGKREYIHVVCAYWNPKISTQNETALVKIDPRLFAKKGCTICGIPTGLTVECSKPGCSREFHVTCALDTKILERTLKEFCNPEKLKCPKHYALISKENIKLDSAGFKEFITVNENLKDHQTPKLVHKITKSAEVMSDKLKRNDVVVVKANHASNALFESGVTFLGFDRSATKRSAIDGSETEHKVFKAEPGGTFEWLAEKITLIQKTAESLGNLSPEFKAEIDKLKLPTFSEIPLKRYSQDNSDKDHQDLQRKYITAQEELLSLRKEFAKIKDAHQLEIKKSDSLKQSIFRLLKYFDLPDHIKLKVPSDVDNALSILCNELDGHSS